MRSRVLLSFITLGAALSACSTDPVAPKAGPSVTPAIAVRGADGVQHVTIDGTDALTFSPNVINAHVGTIAITMKITGTTPHTLTFDDLRLGTGYVAGHASKTLTVHVTKTGTYSFDCDYHPYMTGTLVVT
jgi:plastocyanin